MYALLRIAKKTQSLQINIFFGDQNDRSQIIRQVNADGDILQKHLRRNGNATRKKRPSREELPSSKGIGKRK